MITNDWFTTNLNERNKKICDFSITLNPYEFTSKGFYRNCIDAANNIANRYDNLYVSYSGGLDSEFVLNTFIDASIDITPILVKTSFNKEEYEYALKYCKERNLKYEVLEFSNDAFIRQLHQKTHRRNLHAMLGGLPLIVNDYVKARQGHLLNGYGDPFTIKEATLHQLEHYPLSTISNTLEFSEWDYYPEAYDSDNPNAFFTYNLPVFYSMISEVNYEIPFQQAKAKLYGLEHRQKMFYSWQFEEVACKLNDLHKPNIVSCEIDKDYLIALLAEYKIVN